MCCRFFHTLIEFDWKIKITKWNLCLHFLCLHDIFKQLNQIYRLTWNIYFLLYECFLFLFLNSHQTKMRSQHANENNAKKATFNGLTQQRFCKYRKHLSNYFFFFIQNSFNIFYYPYQGEKNTHSIAPKKCFMYRKKNKNASKKRANQKKKNKIKNWTIYLRDWFHLYTIR